MYTGGGGLAIRNVPGRYMSAALCVAPLPHHQRVQCVKGVEDKMVDFRERSCSCDKCIALRWDECKESAPGLHTYKFCPHACEP